MVLTRADYLNMPRNRGALMGLVQGLLLTRHMLYVGYSLSDEDFHELIHEVRAAVGDSRAQRATMITLAADETQRDLWEDELNIITMGMDPTMEPEAIPEAGRQVDIFLDLVGFLATTSAPFFLDPEYSEMADDESELKTGLEKLAASVRRPPEHAVAAQVREFLLHLGLRGEADGGQYTERLTFDDHDKGRLRIRRDRFINVSERVAVDVRGIPLSGNWESLDDKPHRCGQLTFTPADRPKFRALVEPGERLEIRHADAVVPGCGYSLT